MRIKRYLPNALTCLNLCCGTGALLCALDETSSLMPLALAFIVCAAFFDFADGRVARKMGISSPLGLELDSLADLVSFGVAPAVLIWKAQLARFGVLGLLAVLVFVLAGALRLARFNVLSQAGTPAQKWFVGLPIPGGCLLALTAGAGHHVRGLGGASPGVAAFTMLVAAALMVSTIPFPSPKSLPLGNRKFALGLVAAALAAVAFFQGKVLLLSVAYALSGVALAAGRIAAGPPIAIRGKG